VARQMQWDVGTEAERDPFKQELLTLPAVWGCDLAAADIETCGNSGRRPLRKGDLRLACKKGHAMEEPNLIHKTVRGREVRECRTCANERFKVMRKTKKERNDEEALAQAQHLMRGTSEETIVTEANGQQPAQDQAAVVGVEVDPMDFLEDSPERSTAELVSSFPAPPYTTGEISKIADAMVKDCVANAGHPSLLDETALKPCEDQSPRQFDYPMGTVEPIPPSIADGLLSGEFVLNTSFRQKRDGSMEPVEVSIVPATYNVCEKCDERHSEDVECEDWTERLMNKPAPLVESLHAPHGTPVAIPAPKPKPRVGCEHGFPNVVMCPQCRANRPR
jgi:hypothetical protein